MQAKSREEQEYLIFAGVNGAGKSTLYHSGIWRINGFSSEMRRVNSDEILRSKNGDWISTGDQLAAMREAVRRIDEYY